MRANSVLGILYSNSYDSALPELTNLRTMGSVPFAGRYRLIDFALSGLVNAGVTQVGVITKSNYRSLMDHLGTGKPWDLARKNGGMFLLPPYSFTDSGGVYKNRLDALHGISGFIQGSNKEYVLLCDSNIVCNPDVGDMLARHIASQADITVAYRVGRVPRLAGTMLLRLDTEERVTHCSFAGEEAQDIAFSVNWILLKKSLLERLMSEAASQRQESFEQEVICNNLTRLRIFGYPMQGFVRTIDSLQSYYGITMELLQKENRAALFQRERPVYTKVRDDVPAIYGLEARVSGSLIADACKIEGTVENSILFRGVQVKKGAVVKNSILLQDSYIGEDANMNCVITDKHVVVKPGNSLCGAPSYPVYVGKGIIV